MEALRQATALKAHAHERQEVNFSGRENGAKHRLPSPQYALHLFGPPVSASNPLGNDLLCTGTPISTVLFHRTICILALKQANPDGCGRTKA